MSEADIEARAPMAWQAWQLYNRGAITAKAVGSVLGVSKKTAESHIRRVRQMLKKDVSVKREPKLSNAMLTANGRCRCRLLLPCANCGPTGDELAQLRPNAGTY